MKRFFYSDGAEQFGPYSLEELKEKDIQPDTLVWYQGLDEWTPAIDAALLREELGLYHKPVIDISDDELEKELEQAIRTEEVISPHSGSQRGIPKVWLVESILVTIICCQPLGIVGIIFGAQVEPKYRAGDLEGAKKASDMAGLFTKIGFFLSLAFIIFYFMMVVGAMIF